MRLPWRRAPAAALASPVTVAVGVVAGMVVAFVATATVFYVSASGSAAVRYVIDQRCTDDTGAVVTGSIGYHRAARQMSQDMDAAMPALRAAAGRGGLDTVVRSRYANRVSVSYGDRRVSAQLAARDGGLQHLTPLAGGAIGADGATGAWVPALLAEHYRIRPGDVLTVQTLGGPYPLPVAAVYPDFEEPLDEFWCSERTQLIPKVLAPEGEIAPPAIVIPNETMDELVAAGLVIGLDRVRFVGSRPPADRTAAERHAARVAAFRAEAVSILGANFDVADRAAFPAATAQRSQHAVRDSLLPLVAVSLLVGLMSVVGLAGQWLHRSHAEIRLLWTRGATPAALAGKAVLELLAPLAVGSVLGWLAAWLAAPLLAPAPGLDPWAVPLAGLAAVASAAACVAVLAIAAAARVRRHFRARHSAAGGLLAAVLRWVPWELAAAGAAVLSYRRLRDGAIVVEASSLLPRVDVVALMLPVLCLAVVVGLTLRLSALAIRASHRLRGWRLPVASWAARRISAQRRLVAALLAVGGLAIGVIAVGAGISQTEQAAIMDKGRVFVGSDTSVRLGPPAAELSALPAGLQGTSTKVAVRDYGQRYRVVVVDPGSLADGVTWRAEWSDAPLPELLARLAPAGQGGAIPALQVGPSPPGGYRLADLPPVRTVGTLSTFPGREHKAGMLVIAASNVDLAGVGGFGYYLWTRADPVTAVRVLAAAGEPTRHVYTAAEANDGLPFLVVAWTFDFFVTLGAVLAAVAAAALLVSIEARRRSTAIAHALLARMGVRVRTVFTSHVIELASLAVVAATAGLTGGWLVLRLASQHLDPYPQLTPSPQAVSLLPLTLVVAVVAVLVVLLAAGLTVRTARRARVAELLRG